MEVTVIILTVQYSTVQYSTAQHSTLTAPFFRLVHIPKRIKEPINMYMDKMYVFSGAFSV